jgi:hypothetical protein
MSYSIVVAAVLKQQLNNFNFAKCVHLRSFGVNGKFKFIMYRVM